MSESNCNCKCDLTVGEILMEFGTDELMKKCEKCDYLKYHGGTMVCEKVEGDNTNDN